ncbi:hypothetical protein PoMZ_12970 [Pyricularia oryzae]|uniref:Uncharacterized protein n=1 Tax=Pyricularia oryzae TaxID=318829 RepID=A0A4P7NU66_PYROR|nr:hypothetical protein PoMZ_12970 [Pyricularia oryzae]
MGIDEPLRSQTPHASNHMLGDVDQTGKQHPRPRSQSYGVTSRLLTS